MAIIHYELRMSKVIFIEFLILFFIWFPGNGWACSCIGENSVKQELKKSDVVLLGKILSKDIIIINDDNLPVGFELRRVKYSILVEKAYKGQAVRDTVELITGVGNGDCGYKFQIDSVYIIYSKYSNKYFPGGSAIDPFLYTDVCTRTKPFDKRELREIRRTVRTLSNFDK